MLGFGGHRGSFLSGGIKVFFLGGHQGRFLSGGIKVVFLGGALEISHIFALTLLV